MWKSALRLPRRCSGTSIFGNSFSSLSSKGELRSEKQFHCELFSQLLGWLLKVNEAFVFLWEKKLSGHLLVLCSSGNAEVALVALDLLTAR